jgi:hypothetical protein
VKVVACLLAVLALAACGGGGGDSATDVLGETADNLGEIESGDLTLELLFSGQENQQQGFTLEGPFSLEGDGLPTAELAYTQVAGGEQAQVTFISTGEQAFVEVNDAAYELPNRIVSEIEEATGELETGGLGEQIELGDWIENPKLSDGGNVGGAETDKIVADLDVVEVVNGLLEIAAAFEGNDAPPQIEGQAAEQVENSVEQARLEVYTGKEDRLLRRLLITLAFSPDAPPNVKRVLGVDVEFEFAVSDPNKDVEVTAPENVRPYSDLLGD